MLPPILTLQLDKIAAFCVKHHIIRMWVFGSVVRSDFRSDSDIDVLVEFEPDHTPAWEYFTMPDELASILGREIDFATVRSLRPAVRERVLREAQMIYERT